MMYIFFLHGNVQHIYIIACCPFFTLFLVNQLVNYKLSQLVSFPFHLFYLDEKYPSSGFAPVTNVHVTLNLPTW